MAIRRISEFDNISGELSTGTIDHGGTDFERFWFETSQFAGEVNEANSYYLSKKVSLTDLYAFITKDLYDKINTLSVIVSGLSSSTWAANVISNWITIGIGPNNPDDFQYPITNISCTNLSVANDIHGCALSAKWL